MDSPADPTASADVGYIPQATYAVPGLHLPACPWCRRSVERFRLFIYERGGMAEFEIVCEDCSEEAGHFACLRRQGVTRKLALADYGFRGPGSPKPAEGTESRVPPTLGRFTE